MNSDEKMKNINSARKTVNSDEEVHKPVADSELAIDINSDVDHYDLWDVDDHKSSLTSECNLERDIETLIRISKQFQKDYLNEKIENQFGVSQDHVAEREVRLCSNELPLVLEASQQQQQYAENVVNNFFKKFVSTPRKNENLGHISSSQRRKTFTPKIPKMGPFGTDLIRPSPKKHSCVPKKEVTTIKRSYRSARPYAARYYSFERTHPNLELIEGDTIIPKRVLKRTQSMSSKTKTRTVTRKSLLTRGITWHEFFHRGNVYSATSLQRSSSTNVQSAHTKCTQTISVSDTLSPVTNKNLKFQKHILPQLNIRAECCVQRIPEISIAPDEIRRQIKPNTKLVEIIYEEFETISEVQQPYPMEDPQTSSNLIAPKQDKLIALEQQQNTLLQPTSIQSEFVVTTHTNESTISSTTPLNTPSNRDYDSSLEQSISLNMSRISLLTDQETVARLVPDHSACAQPRTKLKRYVKHRRDAIVQDAIKSSSDPSEFEFDGTDVNSDINAMFNVKFPTFPMSKLIEIVDEIFDTSSDGGGSDKNHRKNRNRLQVVKETSVQTDIIWENVNEFFRQQSGTIGEPLHQGTDNFFLDLCPEHIEDLVSIKSRTNEDLRPHTNNKVGTQSVGIPDRIPPNGHCSHTSMKKVQICSCLGCNGNFKFSVMNIHRPAQHRKPSDSSSSAVVNGIEHLEPEPPIRTKLLPSERYKQMKQAQRDHFESDPRISKTLNKIYKAAKTIQSPSDTTSSSSSNRNHINALRRTIHSSQFFQGEWLQPDLYTFDDELLLFGSPSTDDNEYSSHLLKTESSKDTCTSSEGVRRLTRNNDIFIGNKYMCTNSEDSSGNSLKPQRHGPDLEQYLLNDIENSGSDPAILDSIHSTSSLERKINEIKLKEARSVGNILNL